MAYQPEIEVTNPAGESLDVSITNQPEVQFKNSITDAFLRLRVSNPETIFDSKQIFDNQPVFWDDSQVSGSGTTSTYNINKAESVMAVSASTAGSRIRQTFRRFNYQPGKSFLVLMTGNLNSSTPVSGITKRLGYFDEDNGIFLEDNGTNFGFVIRSNTSGTPVPNRVAQSSWNIDTLDGNGLSGITIDFSKVQIIYINFEWLGVGSATLGFIVNGQLRIAHQFHHSNIINSVYMSTPNLPLRYEINNSGSGSAESMAHICSTVISEGGQEPLGIVNYQSTEDDWINANTIDNIYAIVGIRLKSASIAATIKVENIGGLATTSDSGEWLLIVNPTVSGTFTYSDKTNSTVQVAIGDRVGDPSTNTVTGGTIIDGGYFDGSEEINIKPDTVYSLGSTISGTRDELVLCFRALGSAANYFGSMTWKELL